VGAAGVAHKEDVSAENSASISDEEFALPPGNEGKLLAEMLRPSEKSLSPLPTELAKPRPALRSPIIKEPLLPLPPAIAEMPGPGPLQKKSPLRPKPPGEELPFSGHQFALTQPEVIKLPAGPRLRWPSVDVNQPIPLPSLAVQVSERVSLDDPTEEVSQAAALAQMIPDRSSPAPFLRLALPDPFEHRNVVRLTRPPKEEEVPFSVLPGPSKP
jgi:hypothetical protein